MERIIGIILLLIISTIIIWPWSLVFFLIIALYPIGLIIKHKFGKFVPHWTYGEDETSEIFLYIRSEIPYICKLRYKQYNDNEKTDWIETEEILIEKSDYNTPKLVYSIEENNKESKKLQINTVKGFTHTFFIGDLSENTKYSYEIISDDNSESIYQGRFFTQPLNESSKFKFAIFGDYQMAENLEIIETYFTYLIRKENPLLLVTLGDNVHKHNDIHSWKVFHTLLRKIIPNIPLYTTPGNHDYGSDRGKSISMDAMMYPINMDGRWFYSFKFGNIQFISMLSLFLLDTKSVVESNEFLRKELEKAQLMKNKGEVDWIIFFTHVPWWGPPYNKKNPMDKETKDLLDNWVPILDKYDVDLFFSGHKHSYCRDKNKIITGSMHGVRKYEEASEKDYFLRNAHQYCLVKVSKNQLIVESRTWRNKILDSFIVSKDKKVITNRG